MYDDQGVMLHVSSEIFIPWRIVGYVATDVEEPEDPA